MIKIINITKTTKTTTGGYAVSARMSGLIPCPMPLTVGPFKIKPFSAIPNNAEGFNIFASCNSLGRPVAGSKIFKFSPTSAFVHAFY